MLGIMKEFLRFNILRNIKLFPFAIFFSKLVVFVPTSFLHPIQTCTWHSGKHRVNGMDVRE